MTVEETDKVDFLVLAKNDAYIALVISDHLDWGDEQGHMETLQEKLNSYLSFMESGELFEEAAKRFAREMPRDIPLKVSIRAKYRPTVRGEEFLEKARELIEDAGFLFEVKVIEDKREEDVFASETRSAGDLAGVFETDDFAAYFYLYDVTRNESARILGAIRVATGARDFGGEDVAIRWNAREDHVGLFIRGVLWASFGAAGAKHGGDYDLTSAPCLPAELVASFVPVVN